MAVPRQSKWWLLLAWGLHAMAVEGACHSKPAAWTPAWHLHTSRLHGVLAYYQPHKLLGSRGDIFLGSYRMHVQCCGTDIASGQLAHLRLLQPQSHQPTCMTERRDKPFLTTPGSTDPENGAAGAAPRIQPAWVVKSEKVRVDLGLLKERLDKLKE